LRPCRRPEIVDAQLSEKGKAVAVDREARLREVMAEVNMLDLWAATKATFTQLGLVAAFIILAAVIGQMPTLLIGTGGSFELPNWLIWLFVVWLWVSIYTADKSYHEHRFAWYFPRAGFLWSLPLASYFMVGFQLFWSIGPDVDLLERTGRYVLAAAWWFPFLLAVSLLEIGHNRLMQKRAGAPAGRQVAPAEKI